MPVYDDISHTCGVFESTADTHSKFAMNRRLIQSSPPFRHSRPLTLQPTTSHLNPNSVNLYSRSQPIQQNHRYDGLPLLNPSLTNDFSETAGHHGISRPELYLPPCTPSSQYDSLNTSSHPVFTNPSALAAHHGIPQSLPPVPRTTRYQPEKPAVASSSTSPNNDFDFPSLCSNYLNMLSQKNEDSNPAVANTTSSGNQPEDDAVKALMEVLQGTFVVPSKSSTLSDDVSHSASPEFQAFEEFTNDVFLTSPFEDSPWEDSLTTPAMESVDMSSDLLTSPAIVSGDDFGYGGVSLFGFNERAYEPIKTSTSAHVVHHPTSFDGMYTISPGTPALDSSSFHPSPSATPLETPLDSQSRAPPRRKSAPTGTRKNITPEALVPYDAPIQTRKYVTPSSTSRKEVPAIFAKKRARSQAFGKDDEEELEDEDNINPTDLDAIEAKRRQNTLAARRSRKRKLEYQRELEMSVEKEKEDKEAWRHKALFYEALLKSHGHEVPSFQS